MRRNVSDIQQYQDIEVPIPAEDAEMPREPEKAPLELPLPVNHLARIYS